MLIDITVICMSTCLIEGPDVCACVVGNEHLDVLNVCVRVPACVCRWLCVCQSIESIPRCFRSSVAVIEPTHVRSLETALCTINRAVTPRFFHDPTVQILLDGKCARKM